MSGARLGLHRRYLWLNPEKLEKLRQLDERGLRENILLPLLTRLGCKAPTIYHGPQERGKDIITYTNDPLGQREYVAVVAKVRRSHRECLFIGRPERGYSSSRAML